MESTLPLPCGRPNPMTCPHAPPNGQLPDCLSSVVYRKSITIVLFKEPRSSSLRNRDLRDKLKRSSDSPRGLHAECAGQLSALHVWKKQEETV